MLAQRLAEMEQKVEQAHLREAFRQTLEDPLPVRFPDAPLVLHRDIQRIQQPDDLRRLIVALPQVPDMAAAVALLREAAEQSAEGLVHCLERRRWCSPDS